MSNVILVDHQDNELGEEDKILTHQLGILHRAFSVFIFKKLGNNLELLLQKRHVNKYHSGGLWTNSCCGHPLLHEDTKLAAMRRVKEELGIKIELEKVGSFIYKSKVSNSLIEHELDHVFIGYFEEDNIVHPDPGEIDELKWQDITSFDDWLITDNGCKETTVWLKPAWAIVKKALFN
jgi:isopentenyl-diphosphate Delta-isomerase